MHTAWTQVLNAFVDVLVKKSNVFYKSVAFKKSHCGLGG